MERSEKLSVIIKKINNFADPGLAMEWDNVGLQIGKIDKEIKKILITLDVTDNVVEFAIGEEVDLIISHHPVIFRPLRNIVDEKYLKLIQNDIAVFCAHTNLDVVKKGVNSSLAEKLDLTDLQFLSPETGSELLQVAVYVPQESMSQLAEGLFKQGAGMIGNYSHCLNDYEVSGQFVPERDSDPFVGSTGKLEKVVERKLEFFVDSFNLNNVIRTIKKYHPYETPVYSVTSQKRESDNFGLGLTGKLKKGITLKEMALRVKENLNAPFVKLWMADKDQNTLITRVAICGGSGSSLIKQVSDRADVFVSADFTYHTVLESPIPLIDAGHFYTEAPVLDNLKQFLSDLNLVLIKFPSEKHEINKQIIL